MTIVLFAILGATVKAGTGYWICFAIYCICIVLKAIISAVKEMD